MNWSQAQSKYFSAPLVLIHSGLGPGDTLQHKAGKPDWYLSRLEEIAKKIQKKLHNRSSSALDLSLFGVEQLENEAIFNDGYGAKLQSDGKARLSCSLMDGETQRFSSLSNLEAFRHPSMIVQKLLNEQDRNLSGEGAALFALEMGIEPSSPITEARLEEWRNKKAGQTGTVGCVALDSNSHLAACTSTGGRGMERIGRVSDSCTPAGNFANPWGAVSATGIGENILDAGLATAILSRLEDRMSLQESVSRAFLRHQNKQFGIIGVDREANAIVHATQGTLGFAIITPEKIYIGLDSEDWGKISM